MFKRLCLLFLLIPALPLHAADLDPQLTEAREIFLRGVDGDKTAVRDATRRFRKLSQGNPGDPVYLAYYGACTTLQGRDVANNIEKGRIAGEGLRDIDRAVQMLSSGADIAPERYLDTKLVAANSYIHLPAFFNRYDDGKRLLGEILAHPGFEGMAGGYRAAVYMAAALVARGEKDEAAYRHYLELTVASDPEGRDGRTATRLLQEG